MVRPKKKVVERKEVERKNCSKCQKNKRIKEDYYMAGEHPLYADGRLNVCKQCIKDLIGDFHNQEKVKDTLRMLDKPFLYDTYMSAIEEGIRRNMDSIGIYMKNIALNFKEFTWADSIFTPDENKKTEVKTFASNSVEINEETSNDHGFDLEELKEKYGYGYPDDEYILFEKKFQQLRPSFQLLTTMHEEYFKEYCINKVKETLAKAQGDFKQAKEWAAMVKDVAEAGKLKPSQMSKADLSGGMDTFGQLARLVEENFEIMPLLPQFIEQPKDKVDVVLWCFINYVRDLKGLPEAEYKDIYHFYELRRQDYESQMSDKSLDEDGVEDV